METSSALLTAVLAVLTLLILTEASVGDRSLVYRNCLRPCQIVNCTFEEETDANWANISLISLLQWDCESECRYQCMWYAVDAFQRDGTPVPQFHGKWPFVRVLGMQEPVSVLFSLANFFAVMLGMVRFRQKVDSQAPMYNIWLLNGGIGLNAWFWSMVFHTRDVPFTEKMDYFCALSLVLSSLFVLIVRLLASRRRYLMTSLGVALVAFFTQHIYYLSVIKFDYRYNMVVNVTAGLLNASGWLVFAYRRRKRSYSHKCALCVLTLVSLISLELQDFTPIWWSVDAHALWHAGTSPLPVLWFSFAADDCNFIYNKIRSNQSRPNAVEQNSKSGKTNGNGDFTETKPLNGHKKIE